jgi:hypothetical protein
VRDTRKLVFLKLGDIVLEKEQAGLIGFVQDCKCTRNPEASPKGFLAGRLLIHEHDIDIHFNRERDRLALASVNRAVLRIHNLTHAGTFATQFRTGFGASGCLSSASTAGGTRTRLYSSSRTSIWPIRIR